MYLAIDTTFTVNTELYLINKEMNIVSEKRYSSYNDLSEKLLSWIDVFLKESKINKKDLEGIFVNFGPGSYSSLRIGLSTANLMAYCLNIPVNGYQGDIKNKQTMKSLKDILYVSNGVFNNPVVPFYKMPPHITKNKSCLN